MITQNFESNLILNGIKIIEIGEFSAASMASMYFAEQGAEVIQIKDKSQNLDVTYKSQNYKTNPILDAILSRGKQQLTLDLKSMQGINYLRDLIENADIVIENIGLEKIKSFKIDFHEIRNKINPKLIVCSIPAFPNTDPRHNLPQYESIAGMAGLLYERPLKKPKYFSFLIGSAMSSLFAANGIMAALIKRNSDGLGQDIEVSICESDIFTQVLQVLVFNGAPRSFMPLKMVGTPFIGVWKCADEEYIYVHATIPNHMADLLTTLENNGFNKEIGCLRNSLSPSTYEDPSLVKNIKEADNIKSILENIYKSKDASEWEYLLSEKFCCIKIRTLEDWILDSIESGMEDVVSINDPVFGVIYTPGAAVTSPTHPPKILPREIIDLKIDSIINAWKINSQKICKEFIDIQKNKQNNISRLPNNGPLSGIRVLDLSRIIAGPFSTRILAELGADVITVQSPDSLDWALSFHLIFNSGKRSITLKLSDKEDKQKFWKLLEEFQPNLIVQNYRNLEISKNLGLDYESIKERIPNIAYTYLNGYGIKGDWQNKPAFEQVVQAVTGIQKEYTKNGKPKILPMPILDMGAGLLGGFASQLGLYRQQTGNKSTFITTHMTSFAMLLQVNRFASLQEEECLRFASFYSSKIDFKPNMNIYSEIIMTQTKKACIAGPQNILREWFLDAGLVNDKLDSFELELKEARKSFRKRSLRYWATNIKKSKYSQFIAIMGRSHIMRVFKDQNKFNISDMQLLCKKNYPGLAKLSFIHSPIHLSRTPLLNIKAAPIRGTHTEEIFSKLNLILPREEYFFPYPPEKPFLPWLLTFLRWGIYALKSGSI